MTNNTIITNYIWALHIMHINFSLNISKSTDRMANSVDPDQTAPLGAV